MTGGDRAAWRTFRLGWLAATLWACLARPGFPGELTRERPLRYRATVRAAAFAEKSETIANPQWWTQIQWIIPDGAYVNKGDLITVFDEVDVTNRLQALRNQGAVVDAELARKVAEIRNKQMELADELAARRDRLAVLDTRMARYRALPDGDEVKIAEGRFRVAELEHGASREEAERNRSRHERGMISPADLDASEIQLRRKTAVLDHARRSLEYTRLPATETTVRKTELEIANLRMEIEKLEREIEDNARVSEIRIKGANAQKEIIDTEVREREQDVERLKVLAPISGHIMHLREFRNHILRTGRKMGKGFSYMRMPDESSIALKAVLHESDRKFFREGDEVLIRPEGLTESAPRAPANGEADRPWRGHLAAISKFSHDLAEKEERDWGEAPESGVMVYDVVVRFNDPPQGFRLGMHAQCEVIAGDEIRGPTIPASFVRERNGSRFLAVDGVFREVEGFFTQGLFVLQDPSLLGRRVEMEGTWPKPGRSPGDSTNSGRFRASGELMPAGSADVVVKRILRWLKVQWIIPEDTEVKEGDVVARLEENETSEELRRWESRLSEAESNRKTQEEQTALTAREGAFQLAKESNVLEIARLDTVIADEGRDWPGIFKAELERDEARIRLDETSNRLDRVRRRTETSPVELGRIERDRRRAELQLEAADLRLAKLRRGARPVDRLKAEADFTEQRLKVDTLTRKVETDNFRSACELTRARRRETHVRNRFKERQRWMENLTLRAPRGGIARYTKIWNSGVFSKVNVGGVVGQHFVLMKIADVSRMYLKVEIPERYFNRIRKGLRVEVEVPSTANVRLGGVVSDIEFLFEDKRLKDTKVGLYSSQETLGETVFHVHVEVDDDPDRKLKPGTMATVCFPFDA